MFKFEIPKDTDKFVYKRFAELFARELITPHAERSTLFEMAVTLNVPINRVLDELVKYCWNNRIIIEDEFNLLPVPEDVIEGFEMGKTDNGTAIHAKLVNEGNVMQRYRLRYQVLKHHNRI